MVLHQERRLHPCQMSAHGDAHALLFLGQADQDHVRVLLRHADQVDQPRFGKSGQQAHSGILQGLVDDVRVRL